MSKNPTVIPIISIGCTEFEILKIVSEMIPIRAGKNMSLKEKEVPDADDKSVISGFKSISVDSSFKFCQRIWAAYTKMIKH
jgi:hypothetical protein